MIKVLTSPQEIKQFFTHLLAEQLEAYFDGFQDDAEMLLALADTQSEADNLKSFLLRSSVLADRRSMEIAVQRLSNLSARCEQPSGFGVFYTSVHAKKDRAQMMNEMLVNIINTHLGKQ